MILPQTKKQRREAEVKALLEKIPADLISLNPDQIAEIDTEALEVSVRESSRGALKMSLQLSCFCTTYLGQFG